MKPPQRPLLTIFALMLGLMAIQLGLAALHGWGPDPWWQSTATMVVFVPLFSWAWSGYVEASRRPR